MSRHVIKPSSVAHLVSDETGEDDCEEASLPPRMQIVGSKLPNNQSPPPANVVGTISIFLIYLVSGWSFRIIDELASEGRNRYKRELVSYVRCTARLVRVRWC